MKERTPSGLGRRVDLQAALIAWAGVVLCAAGSLAAHAALPPAQAGLAVAALATTLCILTLAAALLWFRRISNPSFRDLSNTDYLTGLKSRNAFDVDLRNLHAGRDWRQAGFLLVDLDRLKAVNDALGHTAGDAYLRLAASALLEAAGGQSGYRVGGDEFVLLIPNAEAAGLPALADRVLSCFSTRRPVWPVELSLSIGYAAFCPGTDQNLYDTYQRADRAMYAQKEKSRATRV